MPVVTRDSLMRPTCLCLDCGQLVTSDRVVRDFRIYIPRGDKFAACGWILEHCPEGALKKINCDGALVREEPSPLRKILG